MLVCFDHISKYLLCCPPSHSVAVEHLHCPPELLERREECCGPEEMRTAKILELVRSNSLYGSGAEVEDAIEVLHFVVSDFDLYSSEAWMLLAIAVGRHAIWQFEEFQTKWEADLQMLAGTGFFHESTFSSGSIEYVLSEAEDLSRKVSRALLRLEAYHQFLIAERALDKKDRYDSVRPLDVLDDFPMTLYRTLTSYHDYFAFDLLPPLQLAHHSSSLDVRANFRIELLVLNLGKSAKLGFATLWSILRLCSTPVRVFVFGDEVGLEDWRSAVTDLAGSSELENVEFHCIDFTRSAAFQNFISRYPKGCGVDAVGQGLLARTICHELLPIDVEKVIALDIGDIFVLDDIKQLWEEFDNFKEQHLFGARYVRSLNHVNAGVVLYHVRRMRARHFTATVLDAAEDGLKFAEDCLHDQSILNTLHLRRHYRNASAESPMFILPCRWHVVPTTEWQLHWNSPEMWLPEIVERLRYPGIVSARHIEFYCPELDDLLSPWSFLIVSERAKAQGRLRQIALSSANTKWNHCVEVPEGEDPQCCRCGDRASLIHIPGDLKRWPFVSRLLRFHSPKWTQEFDFAFSDSLTLDYWKMDERAATYHTQLSRNSHEFAKSFSSQVCFDEDGDQCCTVPSRPGKSDEFAFDQVNLGSTPLPIRLRVETTALADANLLIGEGPYNALMVVVGRHAGSVISIGMLSNDQLVPLYSQEGAPQQAVGKHNLAHETADFSLHVERHGRFSMSHGDAVVAKKEWGFQIPEDIMDRWRQVNLGIYIGTPPGLEATWKVCFENR